MPDGTLIDLAAHRCPVQMPPCPPGAKPVASVALMDFRVLSRTAEIWADEASSVSQGAVCQAFLRLTDAHTALAAGDRPAMLRALDSFTTFWRCRL